MRQILDLIIGGNIAITRSKKYLCFVGILGGTPPHTHTQMNCTIMAPPPLYVKARYAEDLLTNLKGNGYSLGLAWQKQGTYIQYSHKPSRGKQMGSDGSQ